MRFPSKKVQKFRVIDAPGGEELFELNHLCKKSSYSDINNH